MLPEIIIIYYKAPEVKNGSAGIKIPGNKKAYAKRHTLKLFSFNLQLYQALCFTGAFFFDFFKAASISLLRFS